MMTSYTNFILLFVLVACSLCQISAQTPLTKCPKHYVLTWCMDINNSISKIADNPDIEGMQLKLDWKLIEPEKDLFDFTLIDSVLTIARSFGKKIVFQFQYKTLQG